ncbi:MAG: hypothetical protein ACRDGT_05345 [Candidatus Limnocylindria bacterium]
MKPVLVALALLLAAVPSPAAGAAEQLDAAQTSACVSSVGPGIAAPASVPSGLPGYHAAWYGQSGYMRLCPGERATATVAYHNAGSLGWHSGVMGQAAYLGTWDWEPGQDQPSILGGDGQRGSPATGWPRFDRLAAQPHAYVGPGQVAWFQFSVAALPDPGTYRLGIRPLIEGATWMEDQGVFWEVTVLNADGSEPRPTPPSPAGLYYDVGPGVSAAAIAEVHQGVAWVSQYLAAALGGDRSRRAVAHISVGSGTEQFCCVANGSGFDIVTSNRAWATPNAPAPDTWTASTERKELAAHEYVHLWQHTVGGSGCMLGPGKWLAEGMAEWVAYRSFIEAGLITQAQIDTFIRRQLRSASYVPLWDLVRAWPADTKPYAVGYLAVDRLVAASGPSALRDWCERVGAGASWTAAFRDAFGETPESFYERYEAYRSDFAR